MATTPASRIVYEDADRFVRLEVTDASARTQRDHPATIRPEELATILRGLVAHPRATSAKGPVGHSARPTKSEDSRAFDDESVGLLSKQLSRALGKATALEEVLFFLDRPRDQGIREITSGAAYVDNKTLHVLFANYRHPTIGETELKEARSNPLTVLAQAGYELDPHPFGKVQHPRGLAAVLTEEPQHLIYPYETFVQFSHAPSAQTNQSGDSSVAGEPSVPQPSTEERLRELNRLRDEGLISEEEYRAMKTKILSEF